MNTILHDLLAIYGDTDLIGAKVSSSQMEGENNADNEIDTTLVAANEDGSLVERVEAITAKIGLLTDAAADTVDTAKIVQLLRQIAEAINNGTGSAIGANLSVIDLFGAFDGGADPQGDIFQALGVSVSKSVKDLIDDLDAVVDGVETKVDALALEATVADVDSDLVDAKAVIDTLALEATVADVDSDLVDAKAVIDTLALEATVADVDSDLVDAKAVIDTIDGNVDDVEGSVGALTDVADETTDTATLVGMNRALLARALPREVFKTAEFTAGVGTGDIGTFALFTVTGAVRAKITAICTDTLVGAATLECGYATATAVIIAQIADATALATGELWYDATPTTVFDAESDAALEFVLGDGQDIFLTIGAANLTDGTVVFKVVWEPLTPGAAVVAA